MAKVAAAIARTTRSSKLLEIASLPLAATQSHGERSNREQQQGREEEILMRYRRCF
jgi:hypothetical protein